MSNSYFKKILANQPTMQVEGGHDVWDKEHLHSDDIHKEEAPQKPTGKRVIPFDHQAHHGKKVFVYFNLHNNLWSVKEANGRLLGHTNKISIDSPQFKVSESGRQRVLQEKRKNVHAGVQGTVNASAVAPEKENMKRVSYNPYKAGTFVESGTATPIHSSNAAHLHIEEKMNDQGKQVRVPHVHAETNLAKSLSKDLAATPSMPAPTPETGLTPPTISSSRVIVGYFSNKIKKKPKKAKQMDLSKQEHTPFSDSQDIDNYLKSGQFSIMTGHKSDSMSPEDSTKAHQNLINDVTKMGFKFTPIHGRWNGNDAEASLMIHGIPRHKADELAQKYKQDAHVYSNKGKHTMVDNKGGVHTSGMDHHIDEHLHDNFSEITTHDGKKHRFQLNVGYGTDAIKKNEDLTKTSKNVKEQKKKLFGTQGNPASGKNRDKQIAQQQTFAQKRYGVTLSPSKGKINQKTGKRKEGAVEGIDKPDWRGGNLESQWNPGAITHELGHFEQMPEGVTTKEHQTIMDKQVGEAVKTGGGPTASFKHPAEVQARAAENPLRRRMGLPALTTNVKVKEGEGPRIQLGSDKPAAVRYKDKKGQTVDQLKSAKLLSPENKERMDMIDNGELVFDKTKGVWETGNTPDAKINARAREAAKKMNPANAYFKSKLNKPTKLAASEKNFGKVKVIDNSPKPQGFGSVKVIDNSNKGINVPKIQQPKDNYFRSKLNKTKINETAPKKVTGTNEGYSRKGVNQPVAQMRRQADLAAYKKQPKPNLTKTEELKKFGPQSPDDARRVLHRALRGKKQTNKANLKGVHVPFGTEGQSLMGQSHRISTFSKLSGAVKRGEPKRVLNEIKQMPKPNLTKKQDESLGKSVFADDHVFEGVQMPQELWHFHNKQQQVPYDHPHRELAAKFVADVWRKNKATAASFSEKLLGVGQAKKKIA